MKVSQRSLCSLLLAAIFLVAGAFLFRLVATERQRAESWSSPPAGPRAIVLAPGEQREGPVPSTRGPKLPTSDQPTSGRTETAQEVEAQDAPGLLRQDDARLDQRLERTQVEGMPSSLASPGPPASSLAPAVEPANLAARFDSLDAERLVLERYRLQQGGQEPEALLYVSQRLQEMEATWKDRLEHRVNLSADTADLANVYRDATQSELILQQWRLGLIVQREMNSALDELEEAGVYTATLQESEGFG